MFGTSVWTAAVAVMAVGWIPIAAHCSALALDIRHQGHYEWARDSGAGRWRLLIVHTIPFVVPAVLRHGATRLGHNILALAGLAFLGIGARHDSQRSRSLCRPGPMVCPLPHMCPHPGRAIDDSPCRPYR